MMTKKYAFMTTCPFQILGLKNDASDSDVRAAYLRLAKIYHPDRFYQNRESPSYTFQEIKAAYDSIRTAKQRQTQTTYTQRLDLDFGSLRSIARPPNRREQQASIEIDFETAVKGGEVAIKDSVVARVVAGFRSGDSLQARDAQGGLIEIQAIVRPHPVFKRGDRHLKASLVLEDSIHEPLTLEVETLFGWTSVTLPRTIKSGDEIRLREHGVGRIGDLLLTVEFAPADVTSIPWRHPAQTPTTITK